MKKTFKRKDAGVELTNQIISMIKNGGIKAWNRAWHCIKTFAPFNFDHGTTYKGLYNQLVLAMLANGRIPAFAMYTNDHPAKRGAKGVKIMKPRQYKTEDQKTGEEVWKFAGFSYITVFHYTDLENVDCQAIEAKYAPKTDAIGPSFNPIAEAERIINAMPNAPRIENNGGNSAYYRPSTDSIHMPAIAQFKNAEGYYATLFHEVVHSTGHFTRLDRFKKTKQEFNGQHKKDYSFEELVAELGSCFLCGEAGVLNDDITDNAAAYLQGWIKPLQDNTDWIIKASGLATKAVEYVLNKNAKEDTTNEQVTA